jgi:DNA-binding beta-propeller fold protein YncE
VIDGSTNEVLATIAADSGLVDMCCNSRDNKIYLANGAHAPQPDERRGPPHDYGDSAVTVIDGVTDSVLAIVRIHGRPFVLSYDSASNKVLAACEGGRVDIIDGELDQVTASAGLSQHTAAFCFDPRRRYAYCVGRDRDHSGVLALDVATGRVLANLRTGRSPGALCYNSRRNKMYCTIPVDSELMVLDGATNHVRARVALGRIPGRLCYNSRNDKLYCQVSEASQVVVLDGRTDKAKSKVDMGAPMLYDPHNNRVYAFRDFREVVVTDGVTDTVVAVIPFYEANAICYNPGNDMLYCSGRAGVAVIDGLLSKLVTVLKVDGGANVLCCDYRNNKVYCANPWSPVLYVIDGASDKVDTALALHGSTRALCYNPRNNKVYSAGNQGIRVFDPETDSVVARFSEYEGIGSMLYDPRNNCVYCVGGGKVVVMDGATDKILRTYDLGRGSYSLAFNSAQNRVYLYTTDQGGTSMSVLDGNKVLSGRTGGLQVSSAPSGFSISIDGARTGKTTPSIFRKVAAGQTSLGLTREAYPGWDSTVMVTPGQTTTARAALTLPPDSLWITQADSRVMCGGIWRGPERAIMVNARPEFGYPFHIAEVSAVFYLWDKWPWPDSSFRFKIYGGDGRTLLYESPVLEAVPGGVDGPAVVHELSRPVQVDSGEFYVSVAPIDTGGQPSTLAVTRPSAWGTPSATPRSARADMVKRSYTGSPGHWTSHDWGEFSISVLLQR